MFVDSLTKTATVPQHSAPGPGPTDASKVLAKGVGLSKAYMGQKSSFTVDCSKAGGHAGPSPYRNGRLERKAERPCLGKREWEPSWRAFWAPLLAPLPSRALEELQVLWLFWGDGCWLFLRRAVTPRQARWEGEDPGQEQRGSLQLPLMGGGLGPGSEAPAPTPRQQHAAGGCARAPDAL